MYSFFKFFCLYFFIWFLVEEKISANSNNLKLSDVELNQHELVTKGFSFLFWDHVQQNNNRPSLVSTECWEDLRTVISIKNGTRFSIHQLNALSGKFPKNFQKGEVTDFGDYKGCLLSSSLKKSSTQYCTVSMVPNFEKLNELNISSSDTDRIFGNDYDIPVGRLVEIGICTIASCSSLDVNIIYQQALQETFWTYAGPIHCQSDRTFFEKLWHAPIAQKLSMGLFLASFLSVVVVSFIELMSLRGKFSAKDNRSIFSQIFSPSDSLGMLIGPVNSRRLMSFDGIRLFTYIFVFIFHAVLVQLTAGIGVLVENPNSLNDLPGKWFFQPFASRFYFSALPFFGGLSAAAFLLNRNRNVHSATDIFKVLLLRFLQYQPIILAAVALETLLPLIGSGPIYGRITGRVSNNCANRFWCNLLHISNLFPLPEMCFLPGWTISMEFQLLLVAAPLFYITNKWRNIGKMMTLILSFLGFIYLISVFVRNRIAPIEWLSPLSTRDVYIFIAVYLLRTLPHMWIFLWSFFMVALIEENFHKRISKSSWKILLGICYGLMIIVSFTPAYYNIYGYKVESFSTIIFILLNYGIFWLSCSVGLLRYGDEYLVLLGKRNEITLEMNSKSDELKDADLKLMSEGKLQSANTSRKMAPPTWLDISLRLARSAFFSHMAIIIWYNAQISEPFQFLSQTWFYHMGIVLIAVFIGALIFQILIFGPMIRAFEIFREKIR